MTFPRQVILILVLSLLCAACTVGIARQRGLETATSPDESVPPPSPTNSNVLNSSLGNNNTLVNETLPDKATSPPPTNTPAPTATPPLVPTPATSPLTPQIFSFQVWPFDVAPGDTVTLFWEASGARATICLDDNACQSVPLEGTLDWVIPQDGTINFPAAAFSLSVESDDSQQPAAVAEAIINVKCLTEWFFSDARYAQGCPDEPVHAYAAAQHFERGTMIWIESLGEYFVLEQSPLHEEDMKKQYSRINDPLEIIQDTSAEVQAPPGLYAPQSGFGMVWRGDVSQSPGYRQALGWALEPEFGYEAVYQCKPAHAWSGDAPRGCFLKSPDDEIIVFHSLGGWYLMSEH